MVSIHVKVTGDKEVIQYMHRIDRTIPNAGQNVMKRYMNFVKRSAKARASARHRWSASGKMSKSIKVKKLGKNRMQLISDARSSGPQELGYKPHYVSIKHLSERAKRSIENYQIGQNRISGGTGQGKKGLIFVTESKDFIKPAYDKANKKLDRWIDTEMDQALR